MVQVVKAYLSKIFNLWFAILSSTYGQGFRFDFLYIIFSVHDGGLMIDLTIKWMATSHSFLIHYSLIYSTINLKQFLWYVALKIDDFSIEIVKCWDALGQ